MIEEGRDCQQLAGRYLPVVFSEYESGVAGRRQYQAGFGRRGGKIGAETGAPEALSKQPRKLLVVLNDQQPHVEGSARRPAKCHKRVTLKAF